MIYGRGALIVVIVVCSLFLGMFFFGAFDYQADIRNLRRDLTTLEAQLGVKSGNWVHYLETRINRVAQTQDEYQTSTTKRVDLLEERIRKLERELEEKEVRTLTLEKKMDKMRATNN